MRNYPIIQDIQPCLAGIRSSRNPKVLPPLKNGSLGRRSATMTSLPPESPLQSSENKELNLKPLVLPLKKSSSARKISTFSMALKTRCKNINLSSKKIPQDDYLTFMLQKIPTFDFIREINLLKKKDKILKEVVIIAEEDQEHHCLE